jgi:glutamate/aspartate transport system ATP-binding protein
MRSIPLVLVILWFFLIIPFITGTPVGAETSAIITFTAFEAAFYCEIMRSGIQSVPSGQVHAAQALGLGRAQTMIHVILPQALRNMLPVLLTQTIVLFQDTSLVYAIGAKDMLKAADVVGKNYNRPVEMIVLSALIYFAICFEIRNVSKWYGQTQVLKGCSTRVDKGEVVVVCGPSGSGKSTLIKCVNGLEAFAEGSITVDGVSVGDPKTDLPKLRARVGMVFQHFELFPHMNVLQNLELAQVKVLGRSVEEAAARGMALLDRVGLREHAAKFPGQLSGGQQQRVAIARALAMDPICLLFDEPTSALDPEMIGEVLDVMVELAREGMTMMVVTHEMGFARKVAKRVVFMDRGEIVEDAPVAQFFDAPASERAKTFLARILHH